MLGGRLSERAGWKKYGWVFMAMGLLLMKPLWAFEQSDMVLMFGQYNMLSGDLGMISYNPENGEYLQEAQDTFDSISADMEQWISALPEEKRATAEQEWKSLSGLLLGESGYPGLFEGYDLNADASQRIHFDALQAMLTATPELADDKLSDIQRLYLKISSAVAGYVSLTSNPFGSMAMSMNDGDLRLVTLAADIDGLFTKAINEAKDDLTKQQLRRQQSKWQFIRGTVVQASQSAMPYIVRYQGKQMLRALAVLIESSKAPAAP